MKVVCKVSDISTLTYLKVYEAIPADRSGFIIIDDFENKRFYYAGSFMTLEEGREIKLNSLLE
jgi:hypothetical protein